MSVYQQPVIFPITALSRDSKAVKEAAQDSVVQITENGYGAYVFASNKALEELIAREREDAACEYAATSNPCSDNKYEKPRR